MKRIWLFLVFLICTFGIKAQIVYVSSVQTIANVNVYVVNTPAAADLIVYKAPIQSYQGVNQNQGIWYFTDIQTLANKIIYFTPVQATADLTIYYASVPTMAGWQNPEKKKLLAQ